jgi:multidrug efflux pump subunit AcrB
VIRFFLDRHQLVNVMTAFVLAIGVFVISGLQREGFPGVTLNQSVVSATLAGASPADIEAKLTRPIEEALETVDGIESYASVARESFSVTTVDFYSDFSPEQVAKAERDVQKALDAIQDFPADMLAPPKISRFDPAKIPVLELGITGPDAPVVETARALELALERLPEISSATIVGVGDDEIHVLVDPTRAIARGVTLDEIMDALDKRNVASTGGKLTTYPTQKQVVLSGEYASVDEIAETVLRFGGQGGALRIRDVARVVAVPEDTGLRARAGGQWSVNVVVVKRASADILDAVDGVRALLKEWRSPPGVEVVAYNDQSKLTRNRLNVVYQNGLGGVALVLIVLVIFLSLRVAFWVAFGVPFCLFGVAALLPSVDITINMVSLAGFVLVLGIVVDDAIIIAERIAFHFEAGLPRIEAAQKGAKEMAVPVVGSSLTTILAFSPMFMLGGIPGKFAWAIPTIVILTLAVSLFECFFILPSHLAGSGERAAKPKAGWIVRLETRYVATLRRALPHGGKTALAFIGVFVFSIHYAVTEMPVMLFPQDDADALYVKLRAPEGTAVESMAAIVESVEGQVLEIMGEDAMGMTGRVGHQDPYDSQRNRASAEHEALVSVYLRNEPTYSAHEWVARLKQDVNYPGDVDALFETRRIGPPLGRPVTVHVSAWDPQSRTAAANEVHAYLESIDAVTDLEVDERPGVRQVDLRLDHDRLARQGVTVETVSRTIKAAFAGIPVTDRRAARENVSIRVRFDGGARQDLSMLLAMPVRTAQGRTVALRDLVTPVEVDALAEIHHREGVRTLTLSANIDPASGETATSLARRISTELLPRFPLADPALRVYIGGEATKSAETLGDMPTVMGMAVLGSLLVVMLLTGSLLQAAFVLTAIPLGMIGVVWAYATHGIPISMFALLGITGLAGVVVNDSIVMVTSLNRRAVEARSFESLLDAVASAAGERLRPVLLTTFTTVAGVMPTAYGLGGRDALLSPMSVALGWGLIFATTITLLLVPSLYVIRHRVQGLIRRVRGHQTEFAVPAE